MLSVSRPSTGKLQPTSGARKAAAPLTPAQTADAIVEFAQSRSGDKMLAIKEYLQRQVDPSRFTVAQFAELVDCLAARKDDHGFDKALLASLVVQSLKDRGGAPGRKAAELRATHYPNLGKRR